MVYRGYSRTSGYLVVVEGEKHSGKTEILCSLGGETPRHIP